MKRPILVRHRLAMLILIASATGTLTACDESAHVPTTGSSQTSAPNTSLAHDVAAFCVQVTAAPSEQCVETARRLTGVLSARLKPLLPPDAVLTSNLHEMNGPEGDREVTFLPRRGEGGSAFFEATVRIRAGARAANLDVVIDTYAALPSEPICPAKERLQDMTAKGIVMHRCDRTVERDGTVLLVQDSSSPYGSDEWAQVMIRSTSVAAYRKDGALVRVGFTPVIERSQDPAAAKAAAVGMLTIDQLLVLVHDRAFALAG